MEDDKEKWERIARTFDPRELGPDSRGVENRLIAHPVALQWLKKYLPSDGRNAVLEYGCGPGSFCKSLSEQGYQATGMDFSKAMFAIARSSCPKAIRFIEGGLTALADLEFCFDALTAMMVLQFIEDINHAIGVFSAKLKPDGLFILAVHNPPWAHRLLEVNKKFSNPRQTPDGEMMDFELQPGDVVINRLRTESAYKRLFEQHNFAHVKTAYPAYTKEVIQKFKPKVPTDTPKFLMMAFQKRPE